jgi:hypothetical protein
MSSQLVNLCQRCNVLNCSHSFTLFFSIHGLEQGDRRFAVVQKSGIDKSSYSIWYHGDHRGVIVELTSSAIDIGCSVANQEVEIVV